MDLVKIHLKVHASKAGVPGNVVEAKTANKQDLATCEESFGHDLGEIKPELIGPDISRLPRVSNTRQQTKPENDMKAKTPGVTKTKGFLYKPQTKAKPTVIIRCNICYRQFQFPKL